MNLFEKQKNRAEEISLQTKSTHTEKTINNLSSVREPAQMVAAAAVIPFSFGTSEAETEPFYRAVEENSRFEEARMDALVAKAENEYITFEELNSVLFGLLSNSYNRFGLFCWHFAEHLSEEVYWKALGDVYIGSDNIFDMKVEVKEAFSMPGPRHLMMNYEERQLLQGLPDTATIVSAMTEEEALAGDYGISWTLNREVAVFFRDVYDRDLNTNHLPKTIVELQVPKSKIVAYLNIREEEEIVYLG